MTTLAECLGKIWGGIFKPAKVAFFTALFAGFLAHLPVMTNHFVNHDSVLYTLIDTNSTFSLQQGKWLFLIAKRLIQGDLTTPGIIIPLMILFLAFTAALTVSILKVQSPVWSAAIGCFIVLFPSVLCANIYLGSAVFFFALLLATIAVRVADSCKLGYLLSILFLTMSCGIYSVFIGYAAGLFVLILVLGLLDGSLSFRAALQKGLKYLAILAVSAVLYFLILKLIMRLNTVALMNYRGINQIGHFSLIAVLKDALESYRKVLYFFIYGIFLYRGNFQIEPLFRYINWATLCLAGLFSLWIIIKRHLFKDIPRLLLILALTVIFPFAIHAIGILGQNAYTHWIMVYPFVLVYVFMAAVTDRIETLMVFDKNRTINYKKIWIIALRSVTAIAFAVSLLLCRQWYFITEQSYEYMRYADSTTYAAGVVLINDIQNAQGYYDDIPVVFAGSGAPVAFQYDTDDFATVRGTDGPGYTGINKPIVDNDRLQVFLRNWIGPAFKYADQTSAQTISNSAEVAAMPIYPAVGSIRLIDNCLVVKLSEIALVDQNG